MRAVGLITEYNPLHKGHIYHLEQALQTTGADLSIVVMSGNFVQRGEPAIIDKYKRCQAAINSGASLVVELPAYYALSSAEGFADGAIKTLAALQADSLVFGSECGDTDILKAIAHILAVEPVEYKETLKKELSNGSSFPAARQKALMLSNNFPQDILCTPNNILGIEYLKAIEKYNLPLKASALRRIGSDYHSALIENEFASATALREHISNTSSIDKLPMPESMKTEFMENISKSCPIILDDFSALLRFRLTELFYQNNYQADLIAETLSNFMDISIDLGRRIANCYTGTESITELIAKIKTKQYTYSRISRCLMHILLGITKDLSAKYENKNVPYIRILGFNKTGQEYLSKIRKTCPVPLITKTADYKNELAEDIHCTNIYNQIILQKYNTVMKNEYRQGIYRI